MRDMSKQDFSVPQEEEEEVGARNTDVLKKLRMLSRESQPMPCRRFLGGLPKGGEPIVNKPAC
jgi:hypothetical protein